MPAPDLAPLLAWGRSLGLRGEPVVHSERPWSVLVRWGSPDGVVWLKHCGPAGRYEADVAGLLTGDSAVRPLATAPGLLALPDAGTPLRGRDDALDRWPALLAEHALLQQALAARVPEALAAGTPDLRPALLPEVVGARQDLPPGFAQACADLAAHPVGPTVQHDDLHDGNVLVDGGGTARVTDWGDCSVGHPFGVLLVVLRALRAREGLDDRGARRLTDAYLEPWGGRGHREAALLAQRLQAPARALSWERALAGADDEERARWAEGPSGWWAEVR